jgi:peptide/nickel transport system substrate-binding protein
VRINLKPFFKGLTNFFKRITSRTKTGPAVSLEQDQAMIQNLNETRWPSMTQFTYIFRYLNKSEGLIFRLGLFLIFASAALLVGRYINRHWIPEPTIGGTYTEAVIGTPRFINPILANSDIDKSLTPLVYNGLLRLDPDGNFVNDLANKIEITNDNKTYTITLKPNITWQDGQALTSDDVRFTVESIQDPNIGSPRYSDFRNIKVEAPDSQKIIFKLDKANPDFEDILATGIVPAHIWSEIPPASMNTTEFNLKPVGSGPYMFKEIRKKEKSGDITGLNLERFVNTTTPALLKNLNFRFAPDAQAALDLITTGQANGMRLISSDLFDKAKKIRGSKITYKPYPQVVTIFFNFKKTLFNDKNLRLALRSAIHVNDIKNKVRPQPAFINGPVLVGMPSGKPVTQPRPLDLAGAEKLMETAGWKKENNVYVKNKTKLEFTLTVPDIKEYTDAANLIAGTWNNFGAQVEVKKVDPNVINKDVIKGRSFDAILYADRYDNGLDLYPFWHSTQSFDPGLNLTSYYNKELDQNLTQAQTPNLKPETEVEIYKKIQSVIVNEAPAIFLYQPTLMVVSTANLRSTIKPTLLTGGSHFLDVTDWYTVTKRTWKWNP